jgi:hypothetical protein
VKAVLRDISACPCRKVDPASRRQLRCRNRLWTCGAPPARQAHCVEGSGIGIHPANRVAFSERTEHNDLDVVLGFDAIQAACLFKQNKLFEDRMACVVGMRHDRQKRSLTLGNMSRAHADLMPAHALDSSTVAREGWRASPDRAPLPLARLLCEPT